MKPINSSLKAFLLLALLPLAQQLWAQSWTQKTNIPSQRSQAAAFSIGSRHFVSGGANPLNSSIYDDLWEYDNSTDTWTQRAPLPGTNNDYRNGIGFSINGKGYIGLGVDGPGNYRNTLWEYDPVADAWTQKANLPGAGREGSACFVVNNKAYVIGGAAASRFSQVWEYDPVVDVWTAKSAYPAGPVISPSAFSIGAKGYVTCGYPGSNVTTLTYEYDPAMNQWTAKASLPGPPRQEATAFVLYGKAYCGLGRGFSLGATLNDFYSYDPLSDTWNAEPNFPGAARASAFVVAEGFQAYVGGGAAFNGYSDFYEFAVPQNPVALLQQIRTNEFDCYPIPARDKIFITHQETPVAYCIYNNAGLLQGRGQTGYDSGIDIAGLTPGIYLLLLQLKEQSRMQRIVIEK